MEKVFGDYSAEALSYANTSRDFKAGPIPQLWPHCSPASAVEVLLAGLPSSTLIGFTGDSVTDQTANLFACELWAAGFELGPVQDAAGFGWQINFELNLSEALGGPKQLRIVFDMSDGKGERLWAEADIVFIGLRMAYFHTVQEFTGQVANILKLAIIMVTGW